MFCDMYQSWHEWMNCIGGVGVSKWSYETDFCITDPARPHISLFLTSDLQTVEPGAGSLCQHNDGGWKDAGYSLSQSWCQEQTIEIFLRSVRLLAKWFCCSVSRQCIGQLPEIGSHSSHVGHMARCTGGFLINSQVCRTIPEPEGIPRLS